MSKVAPIACSFAKTNTAEAASSIVILPLAKEALVDVRLVSVRFVPAASVNAREEKKALVEVIDVPEAVVKIMPVLPIVKNGVPVTVVAFK